MSGKVPNPNAIRPDDADLGAVVAGEDEAGPERVGRSDGGGLQERISRAGSQLTRAERRVAELASERPSPVAFSTVAEVAASAGVGVATVMRCVHKLGFEGYGGLQEAAQSELVHAASTAAERIRRDEVAVDAASLPQPGRVDAMNLELTYARASEAVIEELVRRLRTAPEVLVVSGDGSAGVALQFAIELRSLRSGVALLDRNPIDVQRALSVAMDGSMVLGIDIARYDRWVVEAMQLAKARALWIGAVTDHPLSPLATAADIVALVATDSSGPFESHVATLSLLQHLVTLVAFADRSTVAERLDRIEAAWTADQLLIDR